MIPSISQSSSPLLPLHWLPTAAIPTPAATGVASESGSGDILLLVIFVSMALIISFVCSILEAALLSSREAELEERSRRDDKGAIRLMDIKRHRLDDAISAILILNTIAHTAGVAGAGLQAGKIWPDQPFMLGVVFPSVLTLLILVGTEIIPKTLGAVHASRIVGPVALMLRWLLWCLTPLLMLTRLITGALASHEGSPVSRGELAAMVAVAARQGTLESRDSKLLANALRFHKILVEDVMTPRTVVAMVSQDATIEDLLENEANNAHSRLPLFSQNRDQVVGYLIRSEVLGAVARGIPKTRTLDTFRRDILFFKETMSVSEAMAMLIERHEHLAMVNDPFGGIAGLVTLEDLVETLLGVEILDESDKVADLRQEAVALREKRLQKHQVRKDGLIRPAVDEVKAEGPNARH